MPLAAIFGIIMIVAGLGLVSYIVLQMTRGR